MTSTLTLPAVAARSSSLRRLDAAELRLEGGGREALLASKEAMSPESVSRAAQQWRGRTRPFRPAPGENGGRGGGGGGEGEGAPREGGRWWGEWRGEWQG